MKDVVVRLEHKHGYIEQREVEPNTVDYARRWIKHAKKNKYYNSIDIGIYQRIE